MLSRKLKGIASLIFAMCLCMAMAMPAWAAETDIMPQTDGYYKWITISTSFVEQVEGPRTLHRDFGRHNAGEQYTMSLEKSLGVSIEGSLSASEDNVGAALGFSISKSYSIAETLISRPLKANEGLKGYYKVVYDRYKVVQGRTLILDGQPTNVVTDTKINYIKKPVGFYLEFSYYD